MRRQLEHVEDPTAATLDGQVGGDGGVDAPALGRTDVVVEPVAQDRVGELVAPTGGVRQQARRDQPVERLGHTVGRQPGEAPRQAEVVQREAPEHGHHLGQLEIGGGAEHEPPQQHGRPRQLRRRSAGHEPGPPVRDRHGAAVHQRLRHLAGEEGVAPAGPDHRVRQPVVELGPDHRGGERPGVGPVEGLEIDDRPPTLERHPLAELLELRGAPAGPQGHHGEDGQAGEPDQQRGQSQRLAVGHVDVLEDEDQRSPVRQGPEQPGGRREHLGQVLGVDLGAVALDGGAQPVRLVGAGPLGSSRARRSRNAANGMPWSRSSARPTTTG